jgi:putative nucleotidyltransferase with HDIG domain
MSVSMNIDRNEAIELIKKHIKNDKLFKHMLAVEAIMKEVAIFLNEDVDSWSLTGLLHDIDFDETIDNFKNHGILAEIILKGKVDENIIRAIKAHNFENTNVNPESKLEKALIAADAISGLIIACALIMPSKKLNEVKVETIKKKFKSKDFARGSSRERILFCESIGIPKEKFFEIALNSLKSISNELNL